MTLSNRKMDVRLFGVKHVLLPCLWASQITLKGVKKNKFGLLGRQALKLPRRHGFEKFQKVNFVILLKLPIRQHRDVRTQC